MNNGNTGVKYSVLMSVYINDDPEYLRTAIESMLSQTWSPDQFVIVEDGEVSKEIEDIISNYEKVNSDLFTIVRLEKNGGLGNALNCGICYCRNELIARMDADDISLPYRCEKQVKKFSTNPELCILGTQIDEFIGSVENKVPSRRVPCDYETIKKFAKRRSPFNHPTVMYRKTIINELGGYPVLNRKEDLELFVKAVSEGYYSENLKEILLYYRTSVANQKRRKTWVNCKEYIQVMYKFFANGKIGLSDIIYVIFGQLTMFILPSSISGMLSRTFLRE